jgi:ligand-binding sensor domain-containing protein/signal transduction histidine kinase
VPDSARERSEFPLAATVSLELLTKCVPGPPFLSLCLVSLFLAMPQTAYAHGSRDRVQQATAEHRPTQLPIVDGADIRFSRLSTGDVLAQTKVDQIVQDDQGFMWFGTPFGLKRYDAYNFKDFAYDPGNPNSLSGVSIHALFKDRDGALWIGCDQFLNRLNQATEAFTRYPIPFVTHISQDTAGMLWLATVSGLFRLDPATRRIRQYSHDPNNPLSLSSSDIKASGEDRRGRFWVADGEGLDEFDRKTEKVTVHIQLEEPSRRLSFYEDRFGVFWIFHATGNTLAVFDRNANTLMHYSFPQMGTQRTPLTGVTGMLEDQNGALWIATHGAGLLKFDRDHRRFIRYRNNPAEPDSLPQDDVETLFLDREGLIWAGLGRKGFTHFASTPMPFQRIPYLSGRTGEPFVGAIYEDHQGVLWVGTTAELIKIDSKTGEHTSYRLGDPGVNSDVIAVCEDRSGNIWAGTYGHGLFRFDRGTGHFKRYRHDPADPHSLSNDIVSRLLVDGKGTLWVGTADGLNRFEARTERFTTYRLDPQGRNLSYLEVVEDPGHALWIGTEFAGLHRFDPATGQFTAHYEHDLKRKGTLSNNRVNCVYFDHSGTMWVGTQNGLDKFDSKTGTFIAYTRRNGLPGITVSRVLEDDRGDLWMSTNNGVARFNPESGTFNSYSTADGLPGNDLTGWGAGCKGATGEMFFGGFSGATACFPGSFADASYTPPIVLTDVRLFGNPLEIGNRSPLQKSISYARHLIFSHQQNVFSLSFSALSYSNPATNRYRYKLDGLDHDWNEAGSAIRQVTYTRLPADGYTFRVQGATSTGGWSEPGVSLIIDILPPFWATWWFRAGCALLTAISLWYAHRVRLGQIASLFEVRLEERVSERTSVARDLHDTLLQSFQGLMLRLQVVNDLLPEGRAKAQLEQTLERADQAIAEGRRAVYDLRSSTTITNDLAQSVRALGDELATQDSAFHLIVEGAARDLHPIIRDELYRVTREALRNAFSHARAHNIEAEISYGERVFRLRVRDDGEGIPAEILEEGRSGHFGLAGMRERARKIGAKLSIWSGAGTGTEIELSIAGSIAYGRTAGRSLFRLFQRK